MHIVDGAYSFDDEQPRFHRAVERDSLERLCRYIARPAVSNERLSVNDRGQVVYRLKHSFHDGTTHVVLDPMDFVAHLAALVPRSRAHLTDTTACSPRTSNAATSSSPTMLIQPSANPMRLLHP